MIEHDLHVPRSKTPIPPAIDGPRCGYCRRPGVGPGTECPRCGVTMPSLQSYGRPKPSRRRKQSDYRPLTDGVDGLTPEPADELEEYQDELELLEVPAEDQPDDNNLPPTHDEIESIPWS